MNAKTEQSPSLNITISVLVSLTTHETNRARTAGDVHQIKPPDIGESSAVFADESIKNSDP